MMHDASPRLRLPTIALVEDEPIIRDLAACELSEIGFEVIEFESGEAALPYLATHGCEFAVVVTDVQMPGKVSGLELADFLSRHWPALRVLVTSGGALVNPSRLPASARFMPKPWRPADLAGRVRDLAFSPAA